MDERDLHYLKKETKLNGRYILKSVLGEGGFGITYYGEDDLFGNEVAIKEFFPQGIVTRNNEYTDNVTVTYAKQDEAFLAGKKRFIGEARVMAKFNGDQGIVNVTDFFEANNTAYIVMEYLDGITLKEYLKGNRQIPVDELMGLLAPLLESLDDVHQSGLIHRDISPDNIMVLKDGSVKLMDFGAARDYTEFGEKSLSIVLKPGYAPAEQYQSRGVQGPWTDIYALCATIYKCITGKTPEDSIQRVMEDDLKKPSELGVDIVKLHSLYIARNTRLCEWYENGKITVCSKEEYFERVVTFLEQIPETIAVERMFSRIPEKDAAFCNWGCSWWKLRDELLQKMEAEGRHQGVCCDYLNGAALRLLKSE